MASKLPIIIEREYKTRVMKRSFILMTLLGPLFFLLITSLPTLFMIFNEEDTQRIALIDHTGLYVDVLTGSKKYEFVRTDQEVKDYREQGEQAEVSGVLEIRQDLTEDPKALTLYSFKTLPKGVEEYIDQTLSDYTTRQKLLSHNIPQIEELIAESQNAVRVASYRFDKEGGTEATSGAIAVGLGLFLSMAIYMFISMYGGAVLQSVMEEKKSRIMEVMVGSVRPFELMMGKILGVGLVGLTQIFIWIVLLTLIVQGGFLFGADFLTPSGDEAQLASADAVALGEMRQMLASIQAVNFFEITICFVLYFVGGFLLYASIYAGLGSVVSSEEDAQTMMWPVAILMMVAFYVSFACAESPESPLASVASYVPFTAPVVMMIRVAYGVALWEEALSVVVLYASFTLMVFLAARVYRVGVLMYGKKPNFKEIARWMFRGA